jgi:REP element-mobilizing transposase RayT
MGFVKMWVHLVWATKRREPLLNKDLRKIVFSHIRQNALTKNIHIDFINGHVDHLHILVSLDADQSIGNITQLINGESSFWINKNKLIPQKFEWQDDYFAVSVSESGVKRIHQEPGRITERKHSNRSMMSSWRDMDLN